MFPPLSNESIREAVWLWRHDQAQTTEKYNHINKWNTSQVTDMRELFIYYYKFNDNISEWDVSNVTDMSYMFSGALSFNQDVSEWDVSNVTNMGGIFYRASSFNQDVSEWDVSNVTDMSHMFFHASSFNQDVSKWDVSTVTSMRNMFDGASSFNQNVSGWEVSGCVNLIYMFRGSAIAHVLQEVLNVGGFFDGIYKHVPPKERQQLFSGALAWHRRKHFIQFLVGQGYLCSRVNARRPIYSGKVKCDTLFDVEDLSRFISKFL